MVADNFAGALLTYFGATDIKVQGEEGRMGKDRAGNNNPVGINLGSHVGRIRTNNLGDIISATPMPCPE